MARDILSILWLFLPAGMANGAPVVATKLSFLRRFHAPLDGGMMFRGKRLLGPNKTWRGVTSGILLAIIILWAQQLAVSHFSGLRSIVPAGYVHFPTVFLGFLFGVGALGGDAVESFFKRQFDVPSGESWFPFDQIDYILGSAILIALFIRLSLMQYIWLLIVWLLVHVLATFIGFLMGLRDRPI